MSRMKQYAGILAVIAAFALQTVPSYSQTGIKFSKAFQAGKQRRADIFGIMPAHPGAILFAGGSIIEDCEWKELFSNDNIYNRGIDGLTIDEFTSMKDELTRHDAKAVFIEIGSCDLAFQSAEEVSSKVMEVVDAIRKASRKTKVYLFSVLPPAEKPAPGPTGGISVPADTVKAYNALLRQKAKSHKAVYIDLYDSFKGENEYLNPEYGVSNTKLTVEGYVRLGQCLARYVK